MALVIEKPQAEDIDFLLKLDVHISEDVLRQKIIAGEILVARDDGRIFGCIRYGLFWDNLPFLNFLYVLEEVQRQAIGTQLMDAWEEKMKEKGYEKVLTSSLADESAQHFYRKRGYRDIGSFVLPGEAAEIIFMKEL